VTPSVSNVLINCPYFDRFISLSPTEMQRNKRSSSEEERMKLVKELCHQICGLELDSSGSTESLRSTRKHEEDEGTGYKRSPSHGSESSFESISSCSYETESTPLSGKDGRKDRNGKTAEEWGSF
jgi:hypothetical protein